VLGDVGDRPLGRDAVDVGERGEPERLCVGELYEQGATFRMPDRGHRTPTGHVVEHCGGVAQVCIPRVEVSVIAVAVTPMVPAHDPPPGVGEDRRERVERAREVESAVGEQQHRCVGVAPFVQGDPEPAGVDPVLTIGYAGTRDVDVRRRP